MHGNARNSSRNRHQHRHQILPCYADFCSLPQRADTGLHRVALAMAQQNKLVSARQEKLVVARHDYLFFGYVHSRPDCNGRMARFLLNVLLASGGYAWTVIRVDDRAEYLNALDHASFESDVLPFRVSSVAKISVLRAWSGDSRQTRGSGCRAYCRPGRQSH